MEQVLNQILEAQVEEQLGARRYERTEERKGYRNGSYPRQLTTRVGRLTLRVPRTRDGEFSTELFQRYQRSEQALVLALMEMVVNGVSTRKITQITEELCGTSFSKSTVSSLRKGLDPMIQDWNYRSLHCKLSLYFGIKEAFFCTILQKALSPFLKECAKFFVNYFGRENPSVHRRGRRT